MIDAIENILAISVAIIFLLMFTLYTIVGVQMIKGKLKRESEMKTGIVQRFARSIKTKRTVEGFALVLFLIVLFLFGADDDLLRYSYPLALLFAVALAIILIVKFIIEKAENSSKKGGQSNEKS